MVVCRLTNTHGNVHLTSKHLHDNRASLDVHQMTNLHSRFEIKIFTRGKIYARTLTTLAKYVSTYIHTIHV